MLAIAGGKGGSGKTTTALGIAVAMSTVGQHPLVVDADVDMPDLHHRARAEWISGVTKTALEDDPDAGVRRSRRFPGVEILPCRGCSVSALESALETLATVDRPVVVDCPAGAGPDAAIPLRTVTQTVLVSTPDERSLRDTAKTAAIARELDAPPTLTVVSQSDGQIDPSALLDCATTIHVPNVSKSPLESSDIQFRYREAVSSLNKRNI